MKKDYPALHDCLYQIYNRNLTDVEIDDVWEKLPVRLKSIGIEWGWGDTVFRDLVIEHL